MADDLELVDDDVRGLGFEVPLDLDLLADHRGADSGVHFVEIGDARNENSEYREHLVAVRIIFATQSDDDVDRVPLVAGEHVDDGSFALEFGDRARVRAVLDDNSAILAGHILFSFRSSCVLEHL